MFVTDAYLNLVGVGLLVELHEINASIRKTKPLTNTSIAFLKFELASFKVVRRRQKHDVAVCIFGKQANKRSVHQPAVHRDLILTEFDEGMPDFEDLGSVLRHQAFRISTGLELLSRAVVSGLLNHNGLLRHV